VPGRHGQVDGEQRDGDGYHGVGEEDQPVNRTGLELLVTLGH